MKALLLFLLLLCAACAPAAVAPVSTPQPVAIPTIETLPAPASWTHPPLEKLPAYDASSTDPFQLDLRTRGMSGVDLSAALDELLYTSFDDRTRWPASLPAEFDTQKIMELGKDPGLGVRELHRQGITGKGVGIAIVDQTLLVDHVEYADRLVVYEEIDQIAKHHMEAQMHGAAVASIAVGKTVGVAPEASLYYIAASPCMTLNLASRIDFKCYAAGVRRVLEINQALPEGQKIRVITMQIGWSRMDTGYPEIVAAVEEASQAGIFVSASRLEETYPGLKFQGLGRAPLDDPNALASLRAGLWWEQDFYQGGWSGQRLLIPMDSRTTASPHGKEEYVFYRNGGWSWAIPYIGGMYALALQVDPELTYADFWALALESGQKVTYPHEGKTYTLDAVLDPAALIDAVRAGQ